MPSFAHRCATETGWPRNVAICCQPWRTSALTSGFLRLGMAQVGCLLAHCGCRVPNSHDLANHHSDCLLDCCRMRVPPTCVPPNVQPLLLKPCSQIFAR